MSFFAELKRRNVFKVAAAYIVTAWLVAQVAELAADSFGAPDWVMKMFITLLALGLPFAVIFAWAFEMTPEGLKKEKEVDRSQSITSITGAKLNRNITIALILALAYFAFDKFILDPKRDAELVQATQAVAEKGNMIEADAANGAPAAIQQSIAVLPFVDMSAAGDNEYFSDGLTEELLNILSKIKELRVAGRTSSFAFKGKEEDLRSIGEKLNVISILEGSVRKDDKRNRVRITAQLINVEDGYHLWSETYDRELDDIFAIQDEIAHEVAQALRITLLGEDEARLEQVVSTKINSYDLYLRGLQGINDSGFIALDKAATDFQQALTLDPAYTPAKIGLVRTWTRMANTGSMSQQQALSRGLPLLEQVIAEQPRNSDARIQMALLRQYEGDDDAAEKEFIAALDDDPRNSIGLKEYGSFLFSKARIEQSLELITAAVEIDPYSPAVLWEYCLVTATLQRVEVARDVCQRLKEIAPESPSGPYGLALTDMFMGDIARTTKGFADAIERDPGDYEMIAAMTRFWILLGDAEEADRWLRRAEAIGAGQPVPIMSRLLLYGYREQHDLVHDLVENTLAQNPEDRHGSNFYFRSLWAFESARRGDYLAALQPFRQAFPWAFENPLVAPNNLANEIAEIIQIAALIKLADPASERSSQLLELAESLNGKQNPRWGPWDTDLNLAAIAVVRGDHATALEWLNKAWDKKWRLSWRMVLLDNVIFSQLKDEPGYKELVARFEADMEQQRQLAYQLLGIQK